MKRKRRTTMRLATFLLISTIFVFLSGGCNESQYSGGSEHGNPDPGGDGRSMPAFSSDTELEYYIKLQFTMSVLPLEAYKYDDITPTKVISPSTTNDSSEIEQISNMPGNGDFSWTTVQETGIDEADQIKTDGSFLYVTQNQKVAIVDITNAAIPIKINSIPVDGEVSSLYLYNNTLTILYSPTDLESSTLDVEVPSSAQIGLPYWLTLNRKLGVLLMDVSTPTFPVLIKNIHIDGNLISSRLIDGNLHIIQQFLPELPPLTLFYNDPDVDQQTAYEKNIQNLVPMELDDLVPHFFIFDNQGHEMEGGRLIDMDNSYHPEEPAGGSITTITSLDLKSSTAPMTSIGIVADVHTIYTSNDSLYLAATQWLEEPGDIGGTEFKRQTTIHKFNLKGEFVQGVGSGSVPGRVVSRFSFGEYNQILHIATTTGEEGGPHPTSSHHVYCLETTQDGLSTKGSLENLAQGQQLSSVRFLENSGFMATYENAEPFLLIDLSDETNPQLAGRLNVSGFQSTVHSFDENHILTMGKDTEISQEGAVWPQGIQLSLFNIADLEAPMSIASESIGDRGTESEALSNYKAFTFWPEKNLLTLPVELHQHFAPPEYPFVDGYHSFTGLYLFRLTLENNFELLGMLSTAIPSETVPDWTRTLFINDYVLAVTKSKLLSANTEDMAGFFTLQLD